MKRFLAIVVLLLVVGSVFSATLTTFRYQVYTLDRSTNPQFVSTGFDSVHIVLYRDNATTPIDSGYTNDLGMWPTQKLYQTGGYMRAYITKEGYASIWTRFSVANVDTTADTNVVIPLRLIPNGGDTTYTISFRLVNGNATPAVGISCELQISSPFITSTGNLIAPRTAYSPSRTTSDEGGNVELTAVKNTIVTLWVDGVQRFEPFVMDSSRTLGNVSMKP